MIESEHKIIYSFEEIEQAIDTHKLGSIGLEPIIDSLDSYKSETEEQMNLVDNFRKKIFDKTVLHIMDFKEKNSVSAESLLFKLDDFASKYGFEIPSEVNELRDSIYI